MIRQDYERHLVSRLQLGSPVESLCFLECGDLLVAQGSQVNRIPKSQWYPPDKHMSLAQHMLQTSIETVRVLPLHPWPIDAPLDAKSNPAGTF